MDIRRFVESLRFLGQFVSAPLVTGAVAPSSSFLAKVIVEDLDLPKARVVLEFGPGTGSFTEQVLQQLAQSSRLLAIELNPKFARLFRARHPNVALVEDSVANVRTICDRAGIESVDCIVSGLPWASFSTEMQKHFLDETMCVLKPGGRFVTFAYVHGLVLPPAKEFARLLPKYFSEVAKSPVVWLNLPPAFVYRCKR